MGHHNPNIYKLLKFVQHNEEMKEREMAQLALGAPPNRRKSTYVRVDEAIGRLTDTTFHQGTLPNMQQVLQYVDAVAYQLWDVKH